jgi:hypothetical protein
MVGALSEEAVDPELKAAAKSELRAEDFVLSENQKQYTHGNAQSGKSRGVAI